MSKRISKGARRRAEKALRATHARMDHAAGTDAESRWSAALDAATAAGVQPTDGPRVDAAAEPDAVEDAARVDLDTATPPGPEAPPETPPAGADTEVTPTPSDTEAVLSADRERIGLINRFCLENAIDADTAAGYVSAGTSIAEVMQATWNRDADQHDRQRQAGFSRVSQRHDQTDLVRLSRGMSDAMLQLAGSEAVERVQGYERERLGDASHRIDGGEFRGMRAAEMLRVHFSRTGHAVPASVTEEDVASMFFQRAMANDGFASQARLQASDWDRVRTASAFEPWTIGNVNRVQMDGGGGLPGAQGRDQFPNVLKDAMHRMLHAWFSGDSGEDLVWRNVCRVTAASDFRPHYHTFIGGLPDLSDRTESGDFETVQLGDGEQASIAVMRKGYYIRISYETIINDDLGRIMETTMHMGAASNRTVENRMFANVLNPNSGNGRGPSGGTNVLFETGSGTLGNIVTGAMTDDVLWAAWTALKTQASINAHDFIGFSADTLLCNTAQRGLFETLLASPLQITAADRGAGGPKNMGINGKFRNLHDTPRITSNTRSYVYSSARRPIAAAFLRGRDQPYLQQMEKWDMSGTCFFTALDFEVKALSKRGIVTCTGV